MTMIMRSTAIVALAGLAACGGGGGGATAPTATEFSSIVTADQATIARIAGNSSGATGIAETAASQVPTSGSATYRGVGVAGIEVAANRDILMRGDATVTANFASNTLSGSISDIVAVDEANPTPVLVNENIALTGGRITTGARDKFTLNYNGTPEVRGTTYNMSGTMNGQFRGTGASALSATANNQTTVADGANLTSEIGVVAEQ